MFKKIMFSRLISYPLICAVIWTLFFLNFNDNYFTQMALEEHRLYLSSFPVEYFPIIYGVSFGYIYGTISIVFKVRNFNGLTMFLGFFLKVFVASLFTSVGYILLPIELILLIVFLAVRSIWKLPKRKVKPV